VSTLTIADLQPDRRYYVAAFARNAAGVGYGEVLNFTTRRDMNITTLEVTDITYNSVRVSGDITALRSNLQERGFVYSQDNPFPTIHDRRMNQTATAAGEFNMLLSGLEEETYYYVRAFAVSREGISYGNVIRFNTTPEIEEVRITLNFTRTDGQMVARQIIDTEVGEVLRLADLNLPPNYVLVDAAWSYTVTEDSPDELLVSIRTTTQAPPQQQQEQMFMAGVGSFRFEPDRGATRAEVAQVVFNLSQGAAPGQPLTFTDVPAGHNARNAIDYVSARGFMRGDPGGTFRPDDTISRAEAAVVLSNVYRLAGGGTMTFTDMGTHPWAADAVIGAANRGIINGFPDGTFRPAENVTRAQVVTLFGNAENRTLTPLSAVNFVDVPVTHWAHARIMNASISQP
jgi:hypothetical protein